jgi:HK97 family phage major capsid protein
VGKKVRQLPGLIGWSAVVNSGAQVLGPFKDSDITVYHDAALPTATWLPEIGTVTPADPNFASSVLSAKRIAAQVVISRQLLIQSTGNEPLDEFIASRIRLVFSSRLDQAALYGTGSSANQPLGVVSTPGTNSIAVTPPITWGNVCDMRFASTNYDASPEYFGFITSPTGRQTFEKTARFATVGTSIWDAISGETQISKQVTDGRIFSGIWNYLCIATWGAGTDDFAADLIIDKVTQALSGTVVITGSMYCDVAVRWPALFSYTAANAVP